MNVGDEVEIIDDDVSMFGDANYIGCIGTLSEYIGNGVWEVRIMLDTGKEFVTFDESQLLVIV